MVLAGGTNDAPPLGDLLVVRLNANGSLDTTFDADGSRVIDLGDNRDPLELGRGDGQLVGFLGEVFG